LQLEYHGQLEDIEKSDPEKNEDDDSGFREVAAASKGDAKTDSTVIHLESGDHLFFEDLNRLKPVQRFGAPARTNSMRLEDPDSASATADSVNDYLAEIDRQYFGTLASDGSKSSPIPASSPLSPLSSPPPSSPPTSLSSPPSSSSQSPNSSSSATFAEEEFPNYFDRQFFGADQDSRLVSLTCVIRF
jgi:hypothetical protein